jgi:hypothetical protein
LAATNPIKEQPTELIADHGQGVFLAEEFPVMSRFCCCCGRSTQTFSILRAWPNPALTRSPESRVRTY